MDAIRKKMQSLKAETDGLYATIQKFEDATKEYNRQADQVRTKEDSGNPDFNAMAVLRLTVTSETMERKCRTLRLDLMRPMTS